MTKNITKKLFLVFFVTLFLLYIGSSIHQFKIEAVDYQLSSAWLGSDLDIAPLESIVYDSDYRYFSDIIASVEFVNTDKIYVIQSAYDLYMLSVLSMGLDRLTYLSLNYVLGNDIDYYEIVQQNIGKTTRKKISLVNFMDYWTIADYHILGWLRKE